MLRSVVKKRLSRLAGSFRTKPVPARPVEGLPPGVAFETLDGLCQEHYGERLRHCTHVHLSAWKPHGTFRLELTTEAGRRWRLIFKDERYTTADIPALRGLPIRPGPPEFAIQRVRHPGLRRFLPEVYWSREVEPGRHFQYVMADLGDRLERITAERRDLVLAVRVLVEVQAGLKEAFADGHGGYLIVYDRRYSEGLLGYVLGNLEAYRAAKPAPAVDELCRNWQRVVDVHQRDEFYEDRLDAPIHGDYNRSNVRVHAGDRSEVRVVDWEWAGIGVPHADLTSVLKRVAPDDERAALEVFARADPQLDPETHERLFRWCKLERRLLDAGFIARQQLASTRQLPRLDQFIEGAAADVLRTAEMLATAPRRLVA